MGLPQTYLIIFSFIAVIVAVILIIKWFNNAIQETPGDRESNILVSAIDFWQDNCRVHYQTVKIKDDATDTISDYVTNGGDQPDASDIFECTNIDYTDTDFASCPSNIAQKPSSFTNDDGLGYTWVNFNDDKDIDGTTCPSGSTEIVTGEEYKITDSKGNYCELVGDNHVVECNEGSTDGAIFKFEHRDKDDEYVIQGRIGTDFKDCHFDKDGNPKSLKCNATDSAVRFSFRPDATTDERINISQYADGIADRKCTIYSEDTNKYIQCEKDTTDPAEAFNFLPVKWIPTKDKKYGIKSGDKHLNEDLKFVNTAQYGLYIIFETGADDKTMKINVFKEQATNLGYLNVNGAKVELKSDGSDFTFENAGHNTYWYIKQGDGWLNVDSNGKLIHSDTKKTFIFDTYVSPDPDYQFPFYPKPINIDTTYGGIGVYSKFYATPIDKSKNKYKLSTAKSGNKWCHTIKKSHPWSWWPKVSTLSCDQPESKGTTFVVKPEPPGSGIKGIKGTFSIKSGDKWCTDNYSTNWVACNSKNNTNSTFFWK